MNHLNESKNINAKWLLIFLGLITVVVFGFYFFNFHGRLSDENEVWGTFGDYVGGILNPLIAAFAFILIAKTYELQKIELEATRSLLKVSTDDQKNQIKLTAITAHLNSLLMRIDTLKTERLSLLQGVPTELKKSDGTSALPHVTNPITDRYKKQIEELQETMTKNLLSFHTISKGTPEGQRFIEIERDIKELTKKSFELEKQIEAFYIEN